MVLTEVLIAIVIIMFFILSGIGWWTERQRRIKLERALRSLEHIQDLTTEVYQTRDREKCGTVNQIINAWNLEHSAEVGYSLPNIDCSTL